MGSGWALHRGSHEALGHAREGGRDEPQQGRVEVERQWTKTREAFPSRGVGGRGRTFLLLGGLGVGDFAGGTHQALGHVREGKSHLS